MSGILTVGGLAALFISLAMIWLAVVLMIRDVNRNSGPDGKIPWYASLPRMQPNNLFDRYKAVESNGPSYRLYQLGWIVFGIGFVSVMGSKFVDWLSTR
jgi:hypothetical protein